MNPSVHTDDARFVALLERWLQGDFTRADERELHALTETDDFRREAWEGFVALPEGRHEVHLLALRRRLRGEPGSRRIPLVLWAAAAATFAMLLFAVYFFPRFSRDQTPSMARQAEPALPEGRISSRDSAKDDYAATAKSAGRAQLKSAEPILSDYAHADEMVALPEISSAMEDDVAVSEGELKEEKVAGFSQPSPRAPDTIGLLPGGPAAGQQQIRTTPSDFPVGGPAQNVIVSKPETVRYDPAASKPAETRSQPRAEAADKSSGTRESAKKKSDEPENGATPAGGWDNFRRYLRDNARLTEAARNNNASGHVQLQFLVGQDGKPVNVVILRSLGYGCDEEAIRLINSVMWTPAGLGPTTVEVPFVR